MSTLGNMEKLKPASLLGCNGSYGINGIYVLTQYHPPPLDEPTDYGNALKPTCYEEAEALKAAPPWRGAWASKPTIKQRITLWIKWLTRRYGQPGRDDGIDNGQRTAHRSPD